MASFLGTFPGPDTYPGPSTFPGGPPAQVTTPPVFVDGVVIHADSLNALALGIDNLATITLGIGSGRAPSTGKNAKARPACKVYTQNNQSIANGATQVVRWETVQLNTDNGFSLAYGDHIVIQTAGWYKVLGQCAFEFGAAAERALNIHVNGTAISNIVASSNTTMYQANNQRLQVAAYLHLPVGSTIYQSVYQFSGGALNMVPVGVWGSFLQLNWDNPF